jgi:hypothetical protein
MMKRILGLLASVSLFLVVGCARDYDIRLDKTLANLRYQKRLDSNLEKPPEAKSNLVGANVYVRPPLGLKGPTKEIGLQGVDAEKFDITTSFISDSATLHLLVRVDKPKAAPKKKGAETTPPPPTRGDFTADVLDTIKNAYGADIASSKLKSESKGHEGRTNNFKTLSLDLTAKEIKAYIMGEKNSPAQVALIFEYPKDQLTKLSSKIDLCLESFRVGESARRLYAGQEEEGGEGGGGGATPPPGVF